ncbi:MAG: hypothetical protein KGO03_04740 [Gemmatimonadota bacterium]|nr:hypothetical protein [Gemmatimonadota bacterium]
MHRSRAPRALLRISLFALCAGALPRAARAQAGFPHLDDATVLARGQFRLDAASEWTRYNALFAPAGSATATMPLGGGFSFDSLGAAQLPALSGTQSAIGALTGSPFSLSLGRTMAAADARVAVTPIRGEYGLTSRITLGFMVPLVRTRTSIMLRVNPTDSTGNVGINPAAVNPASLARDSAVFAQLVNAAGALQAAQQACQANPAANPSCGAILARPGDVASLLQSAATFSTAFAAVYGENAQTRGAPVVPVNGTVADLAIRGRLAAFDSSFRAFLNGGPLITSTPAGAGAVMGAGDLNTFLSDPGVAGFDSVASTIRISTGDVELSVRVRLFDGFLDSAAARRPGALLARSTLTALVTLPTGQVASPTNPADIGTGRGAMQVGGRFAAYLQQGDRLGLSAAAEYLQPTGKTKTGAFPIGAALPFPPNTSSTFPYTPGAITRLEVAPRFIITHQLGVNAIYDYTNVAANTYASGSLISPALGAQQPERPTATWNGISTAPGAQQAAGFGISYSSVPEYDRRKVGLPIDVTFTHLETLSGAYGMPKSWMDRIQVRFYYNRR